MRTGRKVKHRSGLYFTLDELRAIMTLFGNEDVSSISCNYQEWAESVIDNGKYKSMHSALTKLSSKFFYAGELLYELEAVKNG